ncbi:MAG: DinB family protein [Candidatus Promineifilaceae bacterium]|jgi:uncharacterized damage-inducible protein DinB
MDPFFKDFYDRLSELHHELAGTVEGLPAEALDWQPGPETNSLAVLLTHTAGSERYWIGEVVGEEPAGRERAEEFETLGRSAEELQDLLNLALAHSRQTLSRLSLDNLAEARLISLQGRSCTVAWALLHALEHTAQHMGHAQLTRQMWEEMQ